MRERVKVDDVLHEVAVRIGIENRLLPEGEKLKMPSRATIWRRLDAVDLKGKLIAKRGRRKATMEMSQFGAMEYPKFPLERVEIDHTLTDIFVVDDDDNLPLGRLTLTYCLDVATRYPLGFYLGFEPPSYLTVSACLHHAILPKPDARELYGTEHQWLASGIPNTLVVDNGKEFIGGSLQDACLSLGILLERMPVQTPHFKATVERMFNTFNTGLFHMLPGTTFSNVEARGDYDSVRFASLRQGEIYQMMHIFLLDIYAETFHRGLGAIPARRWEAAVQDGFFPRVPTNPEELPVLLGRVTERVIHHYGIEFESLRYNCPELSLLRHRLQAKQGTARGGEVKIRYLPDDLGHIYAFDPFEMKYIKVPALDQAYAQGLTLWSHSIIRNQVLSSQDQVSMETLGEAKRKIQAIVAASKERSKKGQARKRIARWDAANGTAAPSDDTNPSLWLPTGELENLDDAEWGIESLQPD
ncbi:MAG TPA: Mu transposase C-terminal domain-containing protein [Chloroflexota bacterium]|nr:Mu transposase C-terminal domain-containing protein [Chloroflexota bacterium]